MIDYKTESAREALRDFVKTRLQRDGKDPYWLIERSRLSRETVLDRMLAMDQSNKPAPRQTTLNKLFDALDCRFEDFERYFKTAHEKETAESLTEINSLVGELRQLIADSNLRKTDSEKQARSRSLDNQRRTSLSGSQYSALPEGSERRQLTVVMFDIVDWTGLSQRLDGETLADVLVAYRELCAQKVNAFGGTVAEYVGDGVLAYFGYPFAHEDDAECAIRAALATVTGIGGSLGEDLGVSARCGIATGTMVVGRLTAQAGAERIGSQETLIIRDVTAVGEATNLAARLQQLAEPNCVVISEHTRRLVKGMFAYRDLGAAQIKGFEAPVHAWKVTSERAIRSRFTALRSPALSPLIGRAGELERISKLWDVARKGTGQIAMISGEAGIGKSRLVEAVAEQIVSPESRQFWLYCSPHLQNSALAPMINQLTNAARFSPDDSRIDKLEKLENVVPQSLPDRAEALALYAKLLSLDANDRYPLEPMSPQRQRRRLFDAFLRMLVTLTDDRPGLFVFEDLHWIDPSSDELLGLLIHKIRSLPVLAVITARPEFQTHWEDLETVDSLRLAPLVRSESEALIKGISDCNKLPTELVAQIIDKTDGIPLFIEDVTLDVAQTLAARESDPQEQIPTSEALLDVPDTLHDALMSRLDRLGSDAKRVVQIASIIGRELSYQLLADVSEAGNRRTKEILTQLERADVLYARRTSSALVYVFKHALVQDAAYASLLKRERLELHLRVAEALEDGFPETCSQTPELLAYHFERAGESSKAVDFWLAAGRRSARRSNYVEALDQLNRSLRLATALPHSTFRSRKELDIYLSIGVAQAGYRGMSTPESGRAYKRALEICRGFDNPPEIFSVFSGAGLFHLIRGELDSCRRLAEECLTLARKQERNPPFVMGHRLLGSTSFLTGQARCAIGHLEEALARYELEPKWYPEADLIYTQDQKSALSCYLALAHTVLGNLDRGLEAARLGLKHSEELGQSHTINYSLTFLAAIHHLRRESNETLKYARQSYRMALDQGFGTWVGIAQTMVGASLVDLGEPAQGMCELTRGIATYSSIEATTYKSFGISLLAKSLLTLEKPEEAMDALDKAMSIAKASGEQWYIPELHRLRGAVFLRNGDISNGRECLRHAIRRAKEQDAAFWSLRSATMLARSICEQNRAEEAINVITPVFGLFTEGLDTADLKEARALVQTLHDMSSRTRR